MASYNSWNFQHFQVNNKKPGIKFYKEVSNVEPRLTLTSHTLIQRGHLFNIFSLRRGITCKLKGGGHLFEAGH